jgi:DNA-binding MarR family transcriptional regulator
MPALAPAPFKALLGSATFFWTESAIDDNVNDVAEPWRGYTLLAQSCSMDQAIQRPGRPGEKNGDGELAPITAMLSSRLMVLANLLKRGAILRYKRLVGLSEVEFGLVASLGRRSPMSVARLAEAVGQDKGQISRALAGLVERKLVSRVVNSRDNREVLVSLTRSGLAAHDALVAGALERNQRLLDGLGAQDLATLMAQVERLTERAEAMLAAERDMT